MKYAKGLCYFELISLKMPQFIGSQVIKVALKRENALAFGSRLNGEHDI
jgi:hypothetical protein